MKSIKIVCKGRRANGNPVRLPVRSLRAEDCWIKVAAELKDMTGGTLPSGSVSFLSEWGQKQQFKLFAKVIAPPDGVRLFINGEYEETLHPDKRGIVETHRVPMLDLREVRTVELFDLERGTLLLQAVLK